MLETVPHRESGVHIPVRAVHRLQEELLEPQVRELLGTGLVLRIHQLELLSAGEFEGCAGLRADADPVEAGRWLGLWEGVDVPLAALQDATGLVRHDLERAVARARALRQ